MRLIALNVWCGKLFEKLLSFVKEKEKDTDVFCFQEVLDNEKGVQSAVFKEGKEDIFTLFEEALPDFAGYSAIPHKNERGLATFIKKSYKIDTVREEYVYGKKEPMVDNRWSTIGVNMLYTKISDSDIYHIWNLHGVFPADPSSQNWASALEKKDSPESLVQSENVKRIVGQQNGKRILCGDFNLDTNTESIRILESIPLRNLVKEYGVTSTRTDFFKLPQRLADYIMPSKEVEVNDFKVLDDIVSDHSPLLIDFT